jgi:molecular chaperone GrpE
MENKTKVDQLKDIMKAKKEAEEKKQEPKTEQDVEGLMSQFKAAEDEAKAHYDKLLRVMAEFENFKKRIDRERMEHAKYANQSLIIDLLPVMDDFDRVLAHIPENANAEVKTIVEGIKLVQNHFMTALEKHGFSQIESCVGKPFDPNMHEAIGHVESNDFAEGIVAVEHRRGWKLCDRVVRPAMTSVSNGKKGK